MNANSNAEKQLPNNEIQLTASNIFNNKTAFDFAVRMADAFSKSTIVPKDYQNNPANCLIALEMANRIGTAPMMVMQNLYIVNGRPGWSSQFIVAMINNSNKYKTELQYDIKGTGDDLECYAFAIDRNDRKVIGPTISMKMAKAEGWFDKTGSKWKTMPEVMIRYRAASFFGRLNCPDMIMGIYSADEVIDIPENNYRLVDTDTYEHTNDFNPNYTFEPGELNTHTSSEYNAGFNQSNNAFTENQTTPNGQLNSVPTNNGTSLTCADCNTGITKSEHSFSSSKYGRGLCRTCQNAAKQQG